MHEILRGRWIASVGTANAINGLPTLLTLLDHSD